jgi:hypothetical protein
MKLSNFKFMNTEVPVGIQMLLDFGEYELSVVKNEVSYGNKQGLYEIAVFKGDGQVELPGVTEEGDTVKGFLSEQDVDVIIKKMHLLTGASPKQKEA